MKVYMKMGNAQVYWTKMALGLVCIILNCYVKDANVLLCRAKHPDPAA